MQNPLTERYQTLQQVNDRLQKAGKPLIVIKPADKYLLEDDLVQLVNAGLIPATVTTLSRAKLWSEVLHHLTIHPQPVIGEGDLDSTRWVVNSTSPKKMKKFEALSGIFKKYADQYNFDYLMKSASAPYYPRTLKWWAQ